ncbi:hypothetical protein GOODEAATRI_019187 [Goodea atripinnis]|uniref:Uncharacterized protein n=1 Tax=Goodea atripinnis TaxID=208336 RepID=A0ABV0NLG7_9TELE
MLPLCHRRCISTFGVKENKPSSVHSHSHSPCRSSTHRYKNLLICSHLTPLTHCISSSFSVSTLTLSRCTKGRNYSGSFCSHSPFEAVNNNKWDFRSFTR